MTAKKSTEDLRPGIWQCSLCGCFIKCSRNAVRLRLAQHDEAFHPQTLTDEDRALLAEDRARHAR